MAKNIVTIILDNGYYDYEYYEGPDPRTGKTIRNITIVTDSNDSFNECVYDKKIFENTQPSISYEEFIKDYELEINGNSEDVIDFINNNDIPNNKIIIGSLKNGELNINDKEYIDDLINNLNDIDRIYIQSEENINLVTLKDYKETIDYIDSIVNHIKKLNLSPLEELIYAYDKVRDRYYISEEKDEDGAISRDITSIIKGNKIVCLGFSELFDSIARRLGNHTNIECLTNNKTGHSRNMVHIKDDKHNVDGIFVFDPTYDCKKDETNNHFNSYMYCAKTVDFFKYVDTFKKDYFEDTELNVLEKIHNKESDLNEKNMYIIKSLYYRIYDEEIFKYKEDFNKKLTDFYNLFHTRIKNKDYIEALLNVRIKEYYENPNKFPLSIETLMEMVQNNDTSKEISNNEEIQKRVNRVVLSKTLRKVLEKKQNQ